ncbi:MAG: polyketide synthase, partial [Bacteroidota bacterium]
MDTINEHDIAVIGMSGRFPDAPDLKKYWENLISGYNSIRQSSKEELEASGIGVEIIQHPKFVNASSKLKDGSYFDAEFFGISKREATIMDPQIRLLLETSWHALEDAGYAQGQLDDPVGNFCGMSFNTYLVDILQSKSITENFDPLLYRILNDKDFLATWISYKLNLTGPAMSIQTACSTSLLAIHLACQSLLNYECTLALAGGVAFDATRPVGYIHVAESIYSKDGLCRPFDENASGTVGGDGVGVVVLKRASEAIEDKDYIYGIIKGTAANNDGSHKQAYTAPSLNQQRDVILEALSVSEIDPSTIGMVEAHGTGTKIGDPIEVAAISEAYGEYTQDTNYCAIGSVKSNIGHLDAAAGIASFIKAILCVKNGKLVPSLHFTKPNPALNLESTPFYVSQNQQQWPDRFDIRRAGISSLGVGGTNVHIIVEEPPQLKDRNTDKTWEARPYSDAVEILVPAKGADLYIFAGPS